MTRADRQAYAVCLVAVLMLALRCCGAQPVHAQDDALVLARVVFHEAGFSVADVAGIHSVIARGAERRGISFAAMARAYSPRAHAGMTSRPWAMELQADCSRPDGYPLPWTERRRLECVALIAAAREAVSAAPTCVVDHWGSRDDFRRAVLAGRCLQIVECTVGARNLFATEVYR